jgi:hypothetical protein
MKPKRGIVHFDATASGPSFKLDSDGSDKYLGTFWLVNDEGKRALIRTRLVMDDDGDVAVHVSGGQKYYAVIKLDFASMDPEEKD